MIKNHLTEMDLASYLDGKLPPAQRLAAEGHLGICSECAKNLISTTQLLGRADLLSPALFHHPLEILLARLPELLPNLAHKLNVRPLLFWHVVFFSLTPFLWIALVDLEAISHLRNIAHTLAPWPFALLMTTHFLWIQERLRRLAISAWQEGIPKDELQKFLWNRLAPLQGWRLGGLWLPLVLGLGITLLNWILVPSASAWEGLKRDIIGYYALVITMAMYWGWGWSGWLVWGLAGLARRHPDSGAEDWAQPARALAAGWVMASGLSMAGHLLVQAGPSESTLTLQVWGGFISLSLLFLWSGCAALEWSYWRFVRRSQPRFSFWQPALRLSLILLAALLPLSIFWA